MAASSPASRPHAGFDERFAKALSHLLRQRILRHLDEVGVASPNELSQALGEPLGNVSYHVRILRELDCVELVKTQQRRGAIEHYYRAIDCPWLTRLDLELDEQGWEAMGRLLAETLDAAQHIQSSSADRLADAAPGPDGVVPTVLALVHFRRDAPDGVGPG